MRDRFNKQLEQLNTEMITMGALCEQAISCAAKCFSDSDPSLRKTVIEKEKDILRAQIANDEKLANKPEMVKEKMVEGKVKKYYEENCLLNQAFVKDPSLTVAALLAKESSTVIKFTRFEMGEGLEKKNEDFAAEVAAQMKK